MKTLNAMLASAAMVVCISAAAQGTTEEEYNYLTKGYAIQISSGLDMKKGYTLRQAGSWPVNYGGGVARSAEFAALLREGQTKPCAILMIYKRSDTGLTTYYCIPSLDADNALWQRTLEQLRTATNEMGSGEMDAAIIYGLMHLSMAFATK